MAASAPPSARRAVEEFEIDVKQERVPWNPSAAGYKKPMVLH